MNLPVECSICSRINSTYICHKCQRPMCEQHRHLVNINLPFSVYYCRSCFWWDIWRMIIPTMKAVFLQVFAGFLKWLGTVWFWVKKLVT